LALEEPDLSPRELAVNFTDTKGSLVSEATVYRLLKEHGLITSPAFILMKAADRFANPTTAPNQLGQTDFTYLRSSAGAGSICPPCSMTSRATSWPGSCAPPCRPEIAGTPADCSSPIRYPAIRPQIGGWANAIHSIETARVHRGHSRRQLLANAAMAASRVAA